jgi:hypothetical protein
MHLITARLAAVVAGTRRFRRPNRIVLIAGVTVALTAAMAAPAGARASAASASAATSAPVTISGTINFNVYYPESVPSLCPCTGGETETGTVTIDGTAVNSPPVGDLWTGTSTYQVTDTTNYTTGVGTNCPATTTGSYSGSGSLTDTSTEPPRAVIDIDPPNAGFILYFGAGPENQTTTAAPGCGTTITSPQNLTFLPSCLAITSNPYTIPGTFSGNASTDIGTISVDCSGSSSDLGTYSINGTLTTTGQPCATATAQSVAAASAAAAPAAADSSCGLTITSPPDNSTIAISDPQFVDGAEVGPNDRAPALSALKLKVSGTSTGCSGPVTVNGVSATGSGDWTAEIPLMALATGGVGDVTLTAKASGCDDASNTVTLINLDITNPTENEQEPITTAPAMPSLDAKVSADGYTGDASGVTFSWTLDVRNETVTRPGVWSPGSTTITGSTTGTGEAWQPGSDTIVGGVARLTVTASLPGVTDAVTSFPRWINIPGDSPDKATVIDYLNQYLGQDNYADTLSQIFCVESRWAQFGNNGALQPPIPDVPADWTPNPGDGQPLYGRPADIGIAQLSLEAGTLPLADYWNWQTNVHGGIAVFEQDLMDARALVEEEQARLDARRTAAIAAATANRKKIGDNQPVTAPDITVPQLSDQDITWDAVRLYNGASFDEFHFNADYVLSSNGRNVDLVRTDTSAPEGWVGGTSLAVYGVPPSQAGYWGPAGNLSHPMQWRPGGNQSYVDDVRVCSGGR